ncbi:hypothetical protein [Porphyromonas sp.]
MENNILTRWDKVAHLLKTPLHFVLIVASASANLWVQAMVSRKEFANTLKRLLARYNQLARLRCEHIKNTLARIYQAALGTTFYWADRLKKRLTPTDDGQKQAINQSLFVLLIAFLGLLWNRREIQDLIQGKYTDLVYDNYAPYFDIRTADENLGFILLIVGIIIYWLISGYKYLKTMLTKLYHKTLIKSYRWASRFRRRFIPMDEGQKQMIQESLHTLKKSFSHLLYERGNTLDWLQRKYQDLANGHYTSLLDIGCMDDLACMILVLGGIILPLFKLGIAIILYVHAANNRIK